MWPPVAHWLVGLDWYAAVLVATAVAPTDPAVVFSVLGEREVSGRSGTILEGESGANDPVGIALMASLLTAGSLSGHGMGQVAGEFALQMVVGGAVGVLGGRAMLWFMRRVPLPGEGLYPCARWPVPSRCTAWPGCCTAPASWPCSSRGS